MVDIRSWFGLWPENISWGIPVVCGDAKGYVWKVGQPSFLQDYAYFR